jgi:hypothetical protein
MIAPSLPGSINLLPQFGYLAAQLSEADTSFGLRPERTVHAGLELVDGVLFLDSFPVGDSEALAELGMFRAPSLPGLPPTRG